MENNIQTLQALKTFRYAERKNEIDETPILLIALHGYGQLPQFFIRKFHQLPANYHIVAPEGPHRFYLNGNTGRVGASWMTKEARENDISDNLNWLNELLMQLKSKQAYSKIILLGFSQGGATAARWYYKTPDLFDNLILWSSVFPPDLEKPKNRAGKNLYFLVGKNDEFYNVEQQISELAFYENLGFQTINFEGKHDIEPIVLENLLLKTIGL